MLTLILLKLIKNVIKIYDNIAFPVKENGMFECWGLREIVWKKIDARIRWPELRWGSFNLEDFANRSMMYDRFTLLYLTSLIY